MAAAAVLPGIEPNGTRDQRGGYNVSAFVHLGGTSCVELTLYHRRKLERKELSSIFSKRICCTNKV